MTALSERAADPALRLEIDRGDVARGFAQLVLTIAEIVRELLERQALRRIDAGDLDAAQIERLGSTLLRIRDELERLTTAVTRPSTEGEVR